MQYPGIVTLIMQKGVDNVSLPESIKFQALTEAGSLLLKENQFEESAKAFAKANNISELIKTGDWFMQQTLYKEASYFYRFINDKARVEACAHSCLNSGNIQEAKVLFQVINNQAMLSFIIDNFGV